MARQNGALPAAPVNVVKMGRGDRCPVRSKYAEVRGRTSHDPRGAQVETHPWRGDEREGQAQVAPPTVTLYLFKRAAPPELLSWVENASRDARESRRRLCSSFARLS